MRLQWWRKKPMTEAELEEGYRLLALQLRQAEYSLGRAMNHVAATMRTPEDDGE